MYYGTAVGTPWKEPHSQALPGWDLGTRLTCSSSDVTCIVSGDR